MSNKNHSTEMILNSLTNSRNLDEFFEEHKDNLGLDPFTVTLRKLINQKQVTVSDLIKNAQLDQNYGYQLINGTRKPSRDKILQLGIALELDLKDINQLLQAAEKQPLYVKIPRDAALIFCILSQYNLSQTNDLLHDKNFDTFNNK